MKIKSLASTSKGNCAIVQSTKDTVLIDAGISKAKFKELAPEITNVDAIFITHEHSDHISGAGILSRYFQAPLYMNEYGFKAKEQKIGVPFKFIDLRPNQEVVLQDLKILPFSVKHDAIYTYGFRIEELSTNKILCYMTDTGTVTPLIQKHLVNADAYFIEADYDLELLKDNPEYEQLLKDRINSNYGHLSNDEAVETLEKVGAKQSNLIIFGHLSQNNNTEDRVLEAFKQVFSDYSGRVVIAPFHSWEEI